MFRENVLVNDEIIARITGNMIPVALDYQKMLQRGSKEARFLLPLMKQRSDKQGVWIFSPQGKYLGGFIGFGNMVQKTKAIIDNALKAFGPVTPRKARVVDTHPYRGKGVMPNGSVSLAEYVRQRERSNIKSPVISSVTLSKKEFGAFAPRRGVRGTKWTLPEAVAKKLCRVASPMCYQHAPQPDWVKDIAIIAEVREIKDGVAWLNYKGKLSSERIMRGGKILSEAEVTLTGEGAYDLQAKRMRSLLIVGSGTFRWPEEAPGKRVLFDALVEWQFQPSESATTP